MSKENYTFRTETLPTKILTHNTVPNYNIEFHKDGKTIGTFDFNGPAMVFTGDAEESAKVFIDWVAQAFDRRLANERAAERQKVAQWMIRHSYATGHGDTVEDLLKELDWQAKERGHA
jgi:hypothetical protein